MEKYVIPPFYHSDFKFPSVNKALLKEVKQKLIFAELAAISLRQGRHASEQTAPAGLLRVQNGKRRGGGRLSSLASERAFVPCFALLKHNKIGG